MTMCRCKSCNRQLDNETMKSKLPDGKPEDMCSNCRSKSYFEYNILSDRDYAHSDITEGTSPAGSYYYEFHD